MVGLHSEFIFKILFFIQPINLIIIIIIILIIFTNCTVDRDISAGIPNLHFHCMFGFILIERLVTGEKKSNVKKVSMNIKLKHCIQGGTSVRFDEHLNL